jgi:uncharacterized membrane protein AbrB (regulator of aidB expression)
MKKEKNIQELQKQALIVSNRFFKWFYTIFITVLAAILNYCFDIPQPILSGVNLLLIAIAANKIADQHNRLKNGC